MTFSDGELLPGTPRLILGARSIVLGPYDSPESHDRHFSETYGSGDPFFDSTDELRFSRATSRLLSCRLHVPENPVTEASFVGSVRSALARDAVPVLPAGESLQIVVATHLWIDDAGKELIAFRSGTEVLARTRIATDIEMLHGQDGVCGLILRNPARYLVPGWGRLPPLDDEGALAPLVSEFLRRIDDAFVRRMEDGDPQPFQVLDDLRIRVSRIAETSQRAVLRRTIDTIVETFYPSAK